MCQMKQIDPNSTGPQVPVNSATPGPVSSVTGPEMAPGSPVLKDTKFAKLLKVAIPIIQGGAVGGFGGNWRVPGSGGEAAANFFAQQAHQQLQKHEMALRVAQQQSAEALRQSQEVRNQFYDKNLQSEIEHRQFQEDNPKPEAEHATEVSGYPGTGMYTSGARAGQTFQMNKPTPRNPDGTMKDYSSYGAAGPVPLGPPESEKQLQMREQESEKQKKEQQDFSEKQLQEREGREDKRQRVREAGEDRRANLRADTSTKPKSEDQGKAETYADELLKVNGNDPDKAIAQANALKTLDPKLKELVRKHIRDAVAPGKKGKGTAVDDAISKSLANRAKAQAGGGVPTSP
jgi:hypothetical protein